MSSTRLTGGGAVVDDVAAFLACGIRALRQDGDLQASRRWFDAAYLEAERTGDAQTMARAALGMGGLWVHEHRTAAAAGLLHARLRDALSRIDPDSGLALRLRARLASEEDYRGGGHAAILVVLDEARRCPDPVVRMEALSLAHHCLMGPDHGELRQALAEELIGEAGRAASCTDVLMGLLWQAADLFLDANPHAERRLGELRTLLANDEHLAIGFVVDAIEVMLTIRAGRLDEAEELAQGTLERGLKAGDADAPAWYSAQLVAIRWYQGRLPELLPMLTEAVNSPTLSAIDNSFSAALAVAAAAAGDHRTAEGALATLRGRSLAALPRSSSWLVSMYGIVEAADLLGNAKAAARAYQLLRPFAHLPITASLGIACFGSVQHALGVASLTIGDTERAVAHLREAVHGNLALRHWPAVVASRLRFAEALTRRENPGDEDAAREQRAMARELAASLGLGAPAGPHAPALAATCTRHGRQWRVELGTRTVLVDHSVGMLHLAVLIANPGVEIAAVELAAGAQAIGQALGGAAVSAQPVLDRAAIQRYRQRLSQLREEIEELESSGDDDGVDRARTERDWVLAELAAGTGLSGRPRTFADNNERARLSVGKAIRRALTHIERADATIGAHLRGGVHTGTRCCYRPH